MKNSCLLLSLFLCFAVSCYAQNEYPKIKGYFGVMHPIVTFSEEKPSVNFKDYYAASFPTGINIWKNEKIGFSFEVSPAIRAEDGTSKVNSILFHPGVLVGLRKGYTFAGRLAFDSSGRYGFTPILNKTLIKAKDVSYYAALLVPVRFGNEHPLRDL